MNEGVIAEVMANTYALIFAVVILLFLISVANKDRRKKRLKNLYISSGDSRRISDKVKREVWRRDEGKCVQCGSRERLEYDHIIPISKGGSNTVRNIELLCEKCNREKSGNIV
ncbi:HNH endonuclease [bacterium]|nr:HNH endonuclease [bacterium]MBU4602939.1 HNH endonuclease [bacterium]MCG2707340.1 HNH endonuclease [Candidatus Omnitrophota bacterium]MCG2820863.1 HNH endonuclease [Candidatus Atribacteria bacterium]